MTIKSFVSYAREDESTLYTVLDVIEKERGIEAITAPLNISVGERWKAKIDNIINIAYIVIDIITEESLRSSWVLYELTIAYDRNKFLIPLIRDETPKERIPFFCCRIPTHLIFIGPSKTVWKTQS